ncbi:MAG: CRTAC1 family protein, partial [Acidobacteriota bacterium]
LLYRNQGDGTFVDVADAAGFALDAWRFVARAFADVDGDEDLDLLLGGIRGAEPRLLRNRGDGSYDEVDGAGGLLSSRDTWSFAVGDDDGDGDLDLFLAHWTTDNNPIYANHLWRGDGAGQFAPVDFRAGLADAYTFVDYSFTAEFADLDGDGFPELLVAGDFGTSFVFRNRGDGSYEDVTDRSVITDENGMGAAVGDVDGDGWEDWFVSSILDPDQPDGNWGVSGNRLYRGVGAAEMLYDDTDRAGVRDGGWGWASCFADFDNDGDLDLAHTNGFSAGPAFQFFTDRTRLFRNRGDGTFDEIGIAAGIEDRGQGRTIACFDADRDGDVDLIVGNNEGPPAYYRNRLRQPGDAGSIAARDARFVQLDLRDDLARANVHALGAQVTITTDDGDAQTRVVRRPNHFASQSPARLHIGLGDAQQIARIAIVWPDGTTTVRDDLPAVDRAHRLTRSGGAAPVGPAAIPVGGGAMAMLFAGLLALAALRILRRS